MPENDEMQYLIRHAQQDHLLAIGRWATLIVSEFGLVDFTTDYQIPEWPILASVEIRAKLAECEVARHHFTIRVRSQ